MARPAPRPPAAKTRNLYTSSERPYAFHTPPSHGPCGRSLTICGLQGLTDEAVRNSSQYHMNSDQPRRWNELQHDTTH